MTDDGFDELVEALEAGRLTETVPPHGTLSRVRRTVGLQAARSGAIAAAPPVEQDQAAPSAPAMRNTRGA